MDEPRTYHVQNAGVVLLSPFLPQLYHRCSLLDDQGKFRDDVARGCALQLLHYLATGEARASDHAQILSRVLCGVDLAAAVPAAPELTAEMTAMAVSLLEAAIGNAPVLGHTSVGGFRGNFLVRPGALQHTDGAWRLHVEKRAYDVLLAQVPWSFSLVYHSWMSAPVRVDWQI